MQGRKEDGRLEKLNEMAMRLPDVDLDLLLKLTGNFVMAAECREKEKRLVA